MDTQTLSKQYQETRDPEMRDRLVGANLGLVVHIARKLHRGLSGQIELDELVSAGNIGLLQAVDAFDPSRGLAFSTFASPRIRGAILDELRRQDTLPRTTRKRWRAVESATASAQRRLRAAPTSTEVAAELGVDLETFWSWQSAIRAGDTLPLDGSEDDGAPVISRLRVEEHPLDNLERRERVAVLRDALLTLPERERLVLSLIYFEELKLREVGAVLGVTESRISQIRAEALDTLRERMRHPERLVA